MFSVSKKFKFDAAHKLVDYKGKCNQLHGHTFFAEIKFYDKCLRMANILIDFSYLSEVINKELMPHLDHVYLNDSLKENNPTAEFLAHWIYYKLFEIGLRGIDKVTVWESETAYAEYTWKGDEENAKVYD